MVFIGAHGYRCIAHDRRGHGRSSQPWSGNVERSDQRREIVGVGVHVMKVYPGPPHGMCSTLKDQVNAELLAFFKA